MIGAVILSLIGRGWLLVADIPIIAVFTSITFFIWYLRQVRSRGELQTISFAKLVWLAAIMATYNFPWHSFGLGPIATWMPMGAHIALIITYYTSERAKVQPKETDPDILDQL